MSYFNMKWDLPKIKPIIDHYISLYRDQMGSSVAKGMFKPG